MSKKNVKNKQNVIQDRSSKKKTKEQEKKKKFLKDIEDIKNKVEERKQELDKRFSRKEQEVENIRTQIVQNMFKLMQDVGVDPSNPEDIRSYLIQLEHKNPDLLELFESAFSGLLGEKESYQGSPEKENSDQIGLEKKAVPQFPSLKGLGNKGQVRGSGEPEKTQANPSRRAAELPEEEQQREEPVKDFNTLRDTALKS